MRRLLLVTRKDFTDAVRERQLYFLGSLFLLMGGGIGYLIGRQGATQAGDLARFTLTALLFVSSLAAIVLSYNNLVGKRSSGELRVLLGLPFSRSEVLLGTYLGRLLLVWSMTAAAFALAAVVALFMSASVALSQVGAAIGVTLASLGMFVGIGVGISAAVQRTTKAAVLAFGAFLVFLVRLWEGIPTAMRLLANGFGPLRGDPPMWALVWGQVSPLAALRNAVVGFNEPLSVAFQGYAPSTEGLSGVYVEPWFGAVLVAAWTVLPLAYGFWRFRRADL